MNPFALGPPDIDEIHVYGIVFEEEAHIDKRNNIVITDVQSDSGVLMEAAIEGAPITMIIDGEQHTFDWIEGIKIEENEITIRTGQLHEQAVGKRDR